MSCPTRCTACAHALPTFTRHTEVEPEPVLYDRAEPASGWTTSPAASSPRSAIAAHLQAGKRVAVVSPELHGRDHEPVWDEWRAWDVWSLARRPAVHRPSRPTPRRRSHDTRPPIKAVVFDMDGVLIDAREWHYEALNRALGLLGYEITRYEHLATFDGLPTRRKLQMLTGRARPAGRAARFLN